MHYLQLLWLYISVVCPAGAQWHIASAHLAATFCTAGAVGASKVRNGCSLGVTGNETHFLLKTIFISRLIWYKGSVGYKLEKCLFKKLMNK